ncbi:MAG TPA: Ni/Fe hydrogenase subunit alpha [Pirellulaceae bacterium]|nr:Ni/Fe hydrogenase subunit alpha [Pirellulaceae bacterium]
MSAHSTRTIRVEALTRVEGEGGLNVRLQDGQVAAVELNIYEPPRLFESLLRGRALEEAPDITARICGICPVAYQMSAVHALEAALGVQTSPEIRRLRRLLYCGEWIESHSLHIHLLHAPDFFGCDSVVELAAKFPDEVRRGLRLKKHGNELLEVLGGRAIHPINVAVGGFYRTPRREELDRLVPSFEWGLEAAIAATRWVATFDFPAAQRDYEMVALHHPDEYALNEGRIACTSGLDIPVEEYEAHFEERQVPHSTALHSVRLNSDRPYLVGPLARLAISRQQLGAYARQLADELGFPTPCRNPYLSIVARGLEVVHAYEEALQILRTYVPPAISRIPYSPRAASGCAATEAPRGLLYHRYEINREGKLVLAKIVPPTSQNQWQIEDDLLALLPDFLSRGDQEVAINCERAIRNYDPCISCSTHFLKLKIDGC